MFVVDISWTGAEMWIFEIDERFSDLSENPYLDPFLVRDLPIAMVVGIESVVVWVETAKCRIGWVISKSFACPEGKNSRIDVSRNRNN